MKVSSSLASNRTKFCASSLLLNVILMLSLCLKYFGCL